MKNTLFLYVKCYLLKLMFVYRLRDCFKFVCLRKVSNMLVVKLLYLEFSQVSCFLHLSGRLARELGFFYYLQTKLGLLIIPADLPLTFSYFIGMDFLQKKNDSVNVILPFISFHLVFQWIIHIDKISINCILFIFDPGSSEIPQNKRFYWCLHSGLLFLIIFYSNFWIFLFGIITENSGSWFNNLLLYGSSLIIILRSLKNSYLQHYC